MAAGGGVGLVHANILVYALAYWLCQPVLPFLAADLGADPVTFGYLQTVFSLVQLAGGPIVGRLCDVKGARLALVLSQGGACASYVLLGRASSVPWLFASQAPTLLMHAMHAAQAAITVLASDSIRAAALGRLSLSYGVGMVLGSALGGTLSVQLGHSAVAYLAGLLSALAVAGDLLLLPDLRSAQPAGRREEGLQLGAIVQLLRSGDVGRLVGAQLLLGLGLSVYSKTLPVALQTAYGLDAQTIGRLMSAGAVVGVVANSVLVGWATQTYGEGPTALGATCLLAACLGCLGSVQGLGGVLGLTLGISGASSVVYTVYTSRMAAAATGSQAGTSIGLAHATRTLCGVVGPTLGGYVLTYAGVGGVGALASACCLATVALEHVLGQDRPIKRKLSDGQVGSD